MVRNRYCDLYIEQAAVYEKAKDRNISANRNGIGIASA